MSFAIFNKSSERMSEVASGSVDLAITDPPFNVGLQYGDKVDSAPVGEYFGMIGRVVSEIGRTLKPSGLAIMLLPNLIKKQNRVDNYPQAYTVACEDSGRLSKLGSFSFAVTEDDFSCVPVAQIENHNGDCHSSEMSGIVFGKNPQKLKQFPIGRTYRYEARETHPCPYPAELIRDILDTYFQPGATVLDPFMGTAGLGVEVLRRGGNFYGYEQAKSFFEISQAKLKNAGAKQ